MKLATDETFNPKARRIDEQAACPGCFARAMVFEDGSICCLAEGGISWVPEEGDKDLFARRQDYLTRTTARQP